MEVACGIILFKNNLEKLFVFKGNKTCGLIKYSEIGKFKKNIINYIKEIIYTTLSAQLAIFPIIIYNFNIISLNFLLSNLLVNSIVGIITIGGFLLCIISFISEKFSKFFLIPYELLLKLLIQIAKACSNLPLSKIYISTPKIFFIILYYIFILFINYMFSLYIKQNKRITEIKLVCFIKKLISNKRIIRNFILIIIIALILYNSFNLIPKDLEIYFIDVGQGDSTLIITPHNKKILIDGGGNNNSDGYDVGESILLPYLLDRGITKLDYIIISHMDTDHVGGILYLLNNIGVKNVIIGKQFESSDNLQEFLKIIKDKKIKIHMLEENAKIKVEKDLYFDVLWPSSKNVISENSINNNALVCKLNYINFSMLFTGDIEEEAESILVSKNNFTNNLNSTVLKVGHHGSKTSSTKNFIELIKPKIALIGVGKDNKFGHPNNDVLGRLNDIRCKNL